ncbi:TPA: PapB/FocB family fimbrial expression transcriptional regulator, partial [Salmonella enterica subsp. enterica serovar Muenchen]
FCIDLVLFFRTKHHFNIVYWCYILVICLTMDKKIAKNVLHSINLLNIISAKISCLPFTYFPYRGGWEAELSKGAPLKLNKKSFSGVRIVRAGELEPGAVSEEQFWLLVDISPIHSEKIILALKDYFVSGFSRKVVCERYSMSGGYFSTSVNRLNFISRNVHKLAGYYSVHE